MPEGGGAAGERRRRVERLKEVLLKVAREHGLSQKEIAARLGIPPQYLSDLKHNRRAVAELLARRFGQEFRIRHRWLLSGEGPMEAPPVQAGTTGGRGGRDIVRLPVLGEPHVGNPLKSPSWDRSHIELTGPASAVARGCSQPYVLCVHCDERVGRLRKGDLILVSQAEDTGSRYQIVVHQKRPRLARLGRDRRLRLLQGGDPLPDHDRKVGHVPGLVWGAL
jgi:transcriptional regulator with XRE-family HTH domain